jgi:hypothetical protein
MEEHIIKLRKGKNMKKCVYSVVLHPGNLPESRCNVYSNSKRPDGKWWAHWPKCSSENCPFEHPELLEGAIFDKEEFNNTLKI